MGVLQSPMLGYFTKPCGALQSPILRSFVKPLLGCFAKPLDLCEAPCFVVLQKPLVLCKDPYWEALWSSLHRGLTKALALVLSKAPYIEALHSALLGYLMMPFTEGLCLHRDFPKPHAWVLCKVQFMKWLDGGTLSKNCLNVKTAQEMVFITLT